MTGFYKDYADSSDTHQNSAEASADAAEVSATEAATSASEAATSATEAATFLAAQEDLEVTSASFDTADGTLTLTKANSGTVTTDLDGRYAELTGDTFTGLIEADGGLLIPETSRLEIGDNAFGGNNTSLSTNSSGVATLRTYNNFTAVSTNNLTLAGNGNVPLFKGIQNGNSYEVSLHYGTGQERLKTKSDGIYVTGNIAVSGTVDGVDIAALDTNKANLSGADFTGDVTTTGDLGINTTNPAHPLDVKGNVNVTYGTDPIYALSPLLTGASSTTYSIAEITDIHYASFIASIGLSPIGSWNSNRRAVQILFNFNGTGSPTAPQKGWTTVDPLIVSTFIYNTYSANDISTFESSQTAIVNGTYTLQTTIIDDILDGDYDHLVDYKVGINVDPATEALDVGGNIKTSGTLATGGYTLASTDGTDGQALVTDGSGNVSFGDVTVDVSGKADLSGADFTGDVSVPNIGIGTSTPFSPLTIHKDNSEYRVTQDTFIPNGTFVTSYNTDTSTYGTILTRAATHRWAIGTDEKMRIDDTGYVGINNNNPSEALDVTGNIKTSGTLATGTLNTNSIESTIDSVDYPVYSTSLDGSNAIATLGGTDTGDKVHTLEMRPAEGGVRMHWHQDTDSIAGQTLRFHTTDRGVHVGDDRTGTYTAGDVQNNADLDFGMLVGRESSNLGSNNFGFGYDVDFSVGTASNLGVGSVIDVLGDTSNSVAFGGGVTLGSSVGGATASFVGGNLSETTGDYSFTWGKGELDANGTYPTKNAGTGCVLFGHITEIDGNSYWSLAGGDIDNGAKTIIRSGSSCVAWGTNVSLQNTLSTAAFGEDVSAYYSNYSLIGGKSNSVYANSTVVGGSNNIIGISSTSNYEGTGSACFGSSNLVESNFNFISGRENNSLGDSGACIGRGLKTPLFQPVGGGDYVWDDYSITVGAFNDEAHKYYTNTNNTAWVEDHRFVVGTGTATNAKDNGFIVAVPDSGFSGIIMPNLASSPTYSNDLNAKAGGVPVGGLYRDGNIVKIVLS